jgi:hypothetical protein
VRPAGENESCFHAGCLANVVGHSTLKMESDRQQLLSSAQQASTL